MEFVGDVRIDELRRDLFSVALLFVAGSVCAESYEVVGTSLRNVCKTFA